MIADRQARVAWYHVRCSWSEGIIMGPTMKDLGIDRMSPEQRVALALEIWESLGDDRPSGRLSDDQRAELARRDAELEARPEIALTWELIRASVEGRE
jgi:putative addiction module component (TIGR02574 family)